MHLHHNHDHHNERRTAIVVLLTIVVMVGEIVVGSYTRSMALLADGWHMASHVVALGLTWFAYVFARRNKDNQRFKNGTGKVYALSGYSSALALLVVAIVMCWESVHRLMHPEPILFKQAIMMASLGLVVNGLSAILLHNKEGHGDHNIRAAYLHVLADAITSIAAIIALVLGSYFNNYSLDAFSGLISAIIIAKWAGTLVWKSAMDLLDYQREA